MCVWLVWQYFEQDIVPITYIEARWCNHSCSGKAMSITYSECMCVPLGMQQKKRMRHIVIWPSPSTLFFHIIS